MVVPPSADDNPDHGGSDYLATNINRARDVLLSATTSNFSVSSNSAATILRFHVSAIALPPKSKTSCRC